MNKYNSITWPHMCMCMVEHAQLCMLKLTRRDNLELTEKFMFLYGGARVPG